MDRNQKILGYLKQISNFIPGNVYWFDLDNKLLGMNELTLKSIGGSTTDDFVGKTPYEFYQYDIADEIVKQHSKVAADWTSIFL